jgi:putative FmdB family regulatory protein
MTGREGRGTYNLLFPIKGLEMPIYAYRCSSCGHAKDVLQKLSDAPLTTCPACGAEAFSKQVTAAGFQLKGSGWYATDFRGGSSTPKDGGGNNGGGGAAGGSTPAAGGADGGSSTPPGAPAGATACGGSCACH